MADRSLLICATLGLIAIATAAVFSVDWRDSDDSLNQLNRVTSLEKRMEAITAELEQLKELLTISNSRSITGSASKAETTTELGYQAVNTVGTVSTDLPQPSSSDFGNDLAKAREMRRLEAAEKSTQRKALIASAFAAEAYDEMWSPNVTSSIEQTFQSPELIGGRLASVECRTTLCKVEVQHDQNLSPEDRFVFENTLLMSLANELPASTMRQVNSPDGLRTEIYFAGKGHSLPKPKNNSLL